MAIAAISLAACTDPPTAKRALQNLGMVEIETDGYARFMCGREDWYATRFRARNPQGQIVTGAVCSAALKGATVRFD